jgi:hypothetical protein
MMIIQNDHVRVAQPGAVNRSEGQRKPVGNVDQTLVGHRHPLDHVSEAVVAASHIRARIVRPVGPVPGRRSPRSQIAVAQRAQRLTDPFSDVTTSKLKRPIRHLRPSPQPMPRHQNRAFPTMALAPAYVRGMRLSRSGQPIGDVRLDLHRAAERAVLAPSTLNTQPWRWRVHASRLELFADLDRQVTSIDPQRRLLTISCGAALHHACATPAGRRDAQGGALSGSRPRRPPGDHHDRWRTPGRPGRAATCRGHRESAQCGHVLVGPRSVRGSSMTTRPDRGREGPNSDRLVRMFPRWTRLPYGASTIQKLDRITLA